jgi:hypothetical protein
MRSSRVHTNRIVKSLLYLFESNDTFQNTNVLPLLSFTSEVVAYLPYSHLENVLFIVHHISGIISVQGNDLLSRLTSFLSQYGLSNNDTDPNEKDKIERAASTKNPSKAKGLIGITKSSFDIDSFRNICADSIGYVLLLRLSNFLHESYSGVTKSRLSEYLPGEKERISDRSPTRLNLSVPFDSKIQMISSNSNSTHLDVLIRQYAEFRQLMRAHDAIYGSFSDIDEHQLDYSGVGSNKRERVNSDLN